MTAQKQLHSKKVVFQDIHAFKTRKTEKIGQDVSVKHQTFGIFRSTQVQIYKRSKSQQRVKAVHALTKNLKLTA